MKDVTRDDLRELLGKGWLTHDGMWFYCVDSMYGTDIANRLNKQSIKSMVPFEMQRLFRTLDAQPGQIKNTVDVRDFLVGAMSLILPDSVARAFTVEVIPENRLAWQWKAGECFAFKGMSRIGVISRYECGVMYRIECWLKEIGLKFQATPQITLCMMHQTGLCKGEYKLFFE